MSNWTLIFNVAVVHLLAIGSPGPTFVVVSKYATVGNRRAALLVALGVVFATLTWSAFAATGLGTAASWYPLLFASIQYAGAAYLIYLGAKLLYGLSISGQIERPSAQDEASAAGEGLKAVAAGYLTNISNPKVIAYYTSLFGVMLPSNPSTTEFLLIVATVVTVSALWWSGIAVFFTLEPVRRRFAQVRRLVEGVMGMMLIGFGIKLIASR